ncbi:MAG TPA: flippase [Candidatus Limnocylindrales bacterium]
MTSVPDPAGLPSGLVVDGPVGSTPLAGVDAHRRGRDLRLAAKGGGVVFAGKLFAWGTRFVLAVILARVLAPEGYGLYNLALTAVTIASSFAVLGLDSAVIRWVSIFDRRGDRAGMLGALQVGIGLPALVSLAIAAALVFAAVPVAQYVLSNPEVAALLPVAALLVPFMVLNRQLGAALQGLKKIEFGILAEQFSQPPIRFAIIMGFIGLATLGAFEAVASATLAAGAATLILAFFVVRYAHLRQAPRPVRRETREMLVFSLPIWFSNIVTTVGTNLQTLVLSAFSTLANVGIFAIAAHVNLLASLFHTSVVQSSMAIFADLHDRGDRPGLGHLYQTTSKWTFSLNLPLFIVIVLFPGALLSVFGSGFSAGAPALVILGLEALANSATGTSGSLLDMTGHTRVKFVNSTVAAGTALALNVLLIPPFGLIGAAMAALGATLAVNLLRVAQVWYLLRLLPWERSFVKPILAGLGAFAVGAGVAMALAGIDPILRVLVGGLAIVAVYAFILVRLGISDDDRELLSRAARRFRRRGKGRTDSDADDNDREMGELDGR